MNIHLCFPIIDQSQVSDARRGINSVALALGFSEIEAGKIAIAATEAANNLLKHGGGGELLVQPALRQRMTGIALFALDKGRGHADIQRCLADGYSTAGTPGTGLGAIKRLASEFDIYSIPGKGTALYAAFWPKPLMEFAGLEVGAVSLPLHGEEVNGDQWSYFTTEKGWQFMVADGLGHGLDAHTAAKEAIRIFDSYRDESPISIMGRGHDALRATRGAAVSIAAIDRYTQRVNYCGMGNVAGVLVSHDKYRNMVSLNGTLGQGQLRSRDFQYTWEEGDLLIMHSDGMATHWNFDNYPGLQTRHPALIASVLYRDHTRVRDDVTVVVARLSSTAVST